MNRVFIAAMLLAFALLHGIAIYILAAIPRHTGSSMAPIAFTHD